MTTIALTDLVVTGGVDTHQDLHVAAALDQLGRVLGTQSFPTTPAGYRELHRWLRSFGQLDKVGVEGTGSYGSALARHLSSQCVAVIEVARPNRQVRRRYGKTDVIDAIAAARAVQSGESTGTPKSHDGPVEALRTLKAVQRSANKSRTQALNQIHNLLVTAPEDIRTRLTPLSRRELLATCAAFRIRADDDTVSAVLRLALRELAQRVLHLDQQLEDVTTRLRRITTAVAPDLVAIKAVGPEVASTLLMTAGDNPDRLGSESAFAALCGSNPSRPAAGRRTGTDSIEAATGKPTPPCGASCSSASVATNAPGTMSPNAPPKANPRPKSCAASNATSPARSTPRYPEKPSVDSRSISSPALAHLSNADATKSRTRATTRMNMRRRTPQPGVTPGGVAAVGPCVSCRRHYLPPCRKTRVSRSAGHLRKGDDPEHRLWTGSDIAWPSRVRRVRSRTWTRGLDVPAATNSRAQTIDPRRTQDHAQHTLPHRGSTQTCRTRVPSPPAMRRSGSSATQRRSPCPISAP